MAKYEFITVGIEIGKVQAFLDMLKTLPFVKVAEEEGEHTPLMEQIAEGLKDVKQAQDGTAKPKTLKALLNGE